METHVNEHYDRRYGQIKILKEKNSEKRSAVIHATFNSEDEFQKMEIECKNQMEIKYESIVKLINFVGYKEENLCSSFYKCKYIFEYLSDDLEMLFIKKKKNSKQFSEPELWHILE